MQANIQNVQRFQCSRTAWRAGRPSGARVPRSTCAASKRNCAPTPGAYDLVLSSGFLAFANHAGFLQAVDEVSLLGAHVPALLRLNAGVLAAGLRNVCRHVPPAGQPTDSPSPPLFPSRPEPYHCGFPQLRKSCTQFSRASIMLRLRYPDTCVLPPRSCCAQAGLPVGGVMGTSAGALSGSLYAAGYSPKQVSAQHAVVIPVRRSQ